MSAIRTVSETLGSVVPFGGDDDGPDLYRCRNCGRDVDPEADACHNCASMNLRPIYL